MKRVYDNCHLPMSFEPESKVYLQIIATTQDMHEDTSDIRLGLGAASWLIILDLHCPSTRCTSFSS